MAKQSDRPEFPKEIARLYVVNLLGSVAFLTTFFLVPQLIVAFGLLLPWGAYETIAGYRLAGNREGLAHRLAINAQSHGLNPFFVGLQSEPLNRLTGGVMFLIGLFLMVASISLIVSFRSFLF